MSNAHKEFWENSKSSWKSRLNSRDTRLKTPGDFREERHDTGHVPFKPDKVVTDTRGPGWRTRQGHMVKNQAFYRTGTGQAQNLWDDPIHAGTRTWKYWHGPRLKTDAPLMQKLDQQDDDEERWQMKQPFVNARRVESLARTAMRRTENGELRRASSWAPCQRAKSERMGHGPANTMQDWNDFDTLPNKALKQVFTNSVLNKDKAAINYVSTRLQEEEMWKTRFQQWKRHRRNDSLMAFKHQRAYNDMLERMAGQPPRCQAGRVTIPRLTRRIDKLAIPKQDYEPPDITRMTELRGLVHADNQFALKKLFAEATTGHGDEPRWHETRTVDGGAPAHSLVRSDHVKTSPRSQSVPCMAPPAPHVYDTDAFPRPHTDDVDPRRYKYRVLTPPPMKTYTYNADVPNAGLTRSATAERWEGASQHLRSGTVTPGDEPQDWRQQSRGYAGEQPARPSLAQSLGATGVPYVAPKGRVRVGRGMSHELLGSSQSMAFVAHKGFDMPAANTHETALEPREEMPRKLERSVSVPSRRAGLPDFAATSGFTHHARGFVEPPVDTATVGAAVDAHESSAGPLSEDLFVGNFALSSPKPTCMLGSSYSRGRSPQRA